MADRGPQDRGHGGSAALGALIDFLIVALIVFWLAKKILREESVAKK